jgi:uncharacterized protein
MYRRICYYYAMEKDDIIQKINAEMPNLKEKYQVEKLGVFGSVARGENTTKSDIDILVEFKNPVGFFHFIKLENYLSQILGRKVDLISKKALKAAIREDILKELVYV